MKKRQLGKKIPLTMFLILGSLLSANASVQNVGQNSSTTLNPVSISKTKGASANNVIGIARLTSIVNRVGTRN